MTLFRFNKKANSRFPITPDDRAWVEESFKWLITVYGYPRKENSQILLNGTYFPKTFGSKNFRSENGVDDLCQLLNLSPGKIEIHWHGDLRDTPGVPYEIQGNEIEADTEILQDQYSIHLVRNLESRPNRLIFSLIYEFVKICLNESKLEYQPEEDTDLFMYLAGIYLGFGVILSQNLVDMGRESDGLWETKWSFVSEMPKEIMAFGLALHCKLRQEDNPPWLKDISAALRTDITQAFELLASEPSPLIAKEELQANELFHQADQQYSEGKYDDAISSLQKVLFLTTDPILKCDAFNNIGYYTVRKGDYENSIALFLKALEIDPNYGFANDNLAYALIQVGRLDEGWDYLQRAIKTENNDKAYSFRNMALYYFAKGNIVEAEKHFNLAFDSEAFPVDLLEYHYAEFLLNQGRHEEGLDFLRKAVDKGELEAIKKSNELNLF